MRKLLLTALFGIFVAMASAQPVSWPALPNDGFLVGRAATKTDFESGNAVFVAADGDRAIGKPLSIVIPQYAWHKDGTKKTPVIILQAEEANGQKLIGARVIGGGFMAGLLHEFDLLGTVTPSGK